MGHTITKYGKTFTVVGVAADARLNDPKRDVAMFYMPFWVNAPFNPVFLVRGYGIAGPEVRQAIWSVDPQVAVPTLLPLSVQNSRALAVERFQTLLIASFGGAALLLAALGVYGVLGYGVNLRMREWGLRMALGSSRERLMGSVLMDAAKPALTGAVLGGVGAYAASRALGSLLYGTGAGTGLGDWLVPAGALGLLFATVLVAALPSARRAANAEPAAVLRGE